MVSVMPYILHLHGKWLDRTGKIPFSSPDDVEKYIWDMINLCHPIITPYVGKAVAMEKLHLSYTVYAFEDASPLLEAFHLQQLIPQIPFTPKPRKPYVRTKASRKNDSALEKHNEIRHGSMEGNL